MANATKRRAHPSTTAADNRDDAVFIRKSGKKQEDQAQIANVKTMLAAKGITVPDGNWYVTTIGRRWVARNEVFNRLMDLVKANNIRSVYIEDQKRWGTKNSPELFKFIAEFRKQHSRLYDLRNNRDLAAKDVYSEIMAVIKSHESQAELKDLAFRPLRSKVNNFKERGSWPTGTHPFGFGKRNFAADRELIWEWQPINRTHGQLFYADGKKLKPGPKNIKIPRKDRGTINLLVPSRCKQFIASVRLVYELFTVDGMSFRQIATQLNDAGRKFYNKPFNHALVSEILRNPAYVGDTHYGKVMSGELCSFDRSGEMVEMFDTDNDEPLPITRRPVEDRIVKQNTHKGLIDRKTWNLAQRRLADLEQRPGGSPRSAEYYLKPILVCGHCGKNMSGGSEGKGDKRIVVYMCSTYRSGKSRNQKVACKAYRITHRDAEQLLLDKIKELNLECEELKGDGARGNLNTRLEALDQSDVHTEEHVWQVVSEGSEALANYFRTEFKIKDQGVLDQLEKSAFDFYWEKEPGKAAFRGTPVTVARFKAAVDAVEKAAVAGAKKKLASLNHEHASITKSFTRATEKMQETLKTDAMKLESEIRVWEARSVPLSQRLQDLLGEATKIQSERETILEEWPKLKLRQKGEALRRVFKTVTLRWDSTFHPATVNPSRPRTTNRSGRYSFELLNDKIGWEIATLNVAGSS